MIGTLFLIPFRKKVPGEPVPPGPGPSDNSYLLKEDGSYLLLENGDKILLENQEK